MRSLPDDSTSKQANGPVYRPRRQMLSPTAADCDARAGEPISDCGLHSNCCVAGPLSRGFYNRGMTASSRTPLRACSFESRRAEEMASLLRRQGCVPTVAPSMQEVPLEDNTSVFEFAERLLA